MISRCLPVTDNWIDDDANRVFGYNSESVKRVGLILFRSWFTVQDVGPTLNLFASPTRVGWVPSHQARDARTALFWC